jgi:hypothetical protein
MKSTTYQIRPATAADRAQWDPLWQGYLGFYETTLAPEVTDLLWQRILDPAHEIECRLAAAADASLAGLVHYFPHAHTWYANPVCYLTKRLERGLLAYPAAQHSRTGFVRQADRRHRRLRQLHHRSNRSGNLSFDESRALMNQAGKLFFSPGHATAK